MTPFELYPHLRRAGVGVVGGWRLARPLLQRLRERHVPVVEHLSAFGGVMWSMRYPHAPLIVFDRGQLDVALRLVDSLERNHTRRPLVIVVTTALDERHGLAELGWRRSTYRVGFARSSSPEVLVDDVEGALRDLLASEPPLSTFPVLDFAAPAAPHAPASPQAEEAARFAIDALARELAVALAWAAPVAERQGDALVAHVSHAAVPDATASATFGFNAVDGRFSLQLAAALPAAPALFGAHRQRGVLDALEQLRDPAIGDAAFDGAFVVAGAELAEPVRVAGLAEARALREHVVRAAAALDSIEWSDEVLCAHGAALGRAEALAAADAWLVLWRALARRRAGFT